MRLAALRSFLLAGLLIFAQLGVMAHALSHVGDDDHGGAGHPACEWCTAYTALDAGAPAAMASTPILPPSADAPPGSDAAPARQLRAPAYRVRAPPALS